MKSKIIIQSNPINITFLFIESSLEWGNDKSTHLKFEIENGRIVSAHHSLFNWSIGASVKEIECYIQAKEKEQERYQEMIHQNFLTKQQKDILFYEEEKKKRRIWEEEHWIETEQGDGYFN